MTDDPRSIAPETSSIPSPAVAPNSQPIATRLTTGPSPWQVREQIDRLAAHPTFSRSPTSLKLLRFFGDNILSAGGRPVSQKVVADVLLGLTTGFRPTENPLVRMQVVRLRRKLLDYYGGDGAEDAVLIKLPRGRYCLVAAWNPASAAGLASNAAVATLAGDPPDPSAHPQAWSPSGAVRRSKFGKPVVLVFEPADAGLDASWQGLSAAIASSLVPNLLGHRALVAIGPLSRRRADMEGVRAEEACDRYHADYLLDGRVSLDQDAVVATLHLLPRGSDLAVWTQWCSEDLAALPANLASERKPDAAAGSPWLTGRVGMIGERLAGRIAVLLQEAFSPPIG